MKWMRSITSTAKGGRPRRPLRCLRRDQLDERAPSLARATERVLQRRRCRATSATCCATTATVDAHASPSKRHNRALRCGRVNGRRAAEHGQAHRGRHRQGLQNARLCPCVSSVARHAARPAERQRGSAIDGSTSAFLLLAQSAQAKRIEQCFGFGKTVGATLQAMVHGIEAALRPPRLCGK